MISRGPPFCSRNELLSDTRQTHRLVAHTVAESERGCPGAFSERREGDIRRADRVRRQLGDATIARDGEIARVLAGQGHAANRKAREPGILKTGCLWSAGLSNWLVAEAHLSGEFLHDGYHIHLPDPVVPRVSNQQVA